MTDFRATQAQRLAEGWDARKGLFASASLVIGLLCLLLCAPTCQAQKPATAPTWQVSVASAPSVIQPGGDAQILIVATNIGGAPMDGEAAPITVSDELPGGLEATAISANVGPNGIRGNERGFALFSFIPITCQSVAVALSCTYPGPVPPYEFIEMTVHVRAVGSVSAPNEVTVSGGGGHFATAKQHITMGAAPPNFGVEAFEMSPMNEDGSMNTQAGSHPFGLTTTISVAKLLVNEGEQKQAPVAGVRNLTFELPPGLLANVNVVPQCTEAEFSEGGVTGVNGCPGDTAIGVSTATVVIPDNFFHFPGPFTMSVPLFNLAPSIGEPARFGFDVAGVRVVLDTAVRTGGDYGVTVTASDISQVGGFLRDQVTFWGVPGSPSHDNSRGWECIGGGVNGLSLFAITAGVKPCVAAEASHPVPFLTLPTACTSLTATVRGESWAAPDRSAEELNSRFTMPQALDGCDRLGFEPEIDVAPDVTEASSPSGLTVRLHLPQQEAALNAEGLAVSALEDSRVALPEGVTTDPSGADGLGTCSEGQMGFTGTEADGGRDLFTPDYPSCPNAAKVGTMRVDTPVLPNPLEGAVYLATPYQNPFGSLLAIYLVAEDPISGVLLKLAGEVSPDPRTGQLVTTFKQTPEVPFENLMLHFFGGDRAPLVTPSTCGTYTTTALFTPWDGNGPIESTSSFKIDHGQNGSACPSGGAPPFHPHLNAGTESNSAGTYSPLDIELTRGDSEQEFTHLSLKLPPGLSGKLAGVAKCSDAQIAAAQARTGSHGGQEEEEHPSCPAASQIGHTLVGAGVGSVLVYVPGKLYLAGPYHGAPLSVVSITSAKAGPFDLGTVVVREALRVNPETAEVFVDAAGSDPLPHIIQGVPTHLRKILIYLDRPEFSLNPTSCERMSIASTVLGSGADFATEADDQPVTVTSPFQAADCAALGFKPKLKLMLKGSTKRTGLPALKAVVTPRPGQANIGRAVVTLPRSEFLEQGHIGTTCTRVQFNAGGGNGEQCPARSVYGHAVARTPLLDEPLKGPVFLRSNGGERKLPDLVAALHSKDINIDLVGFIKSLHPKGSSFSRIRSIFASVPDAPVSRFTLEMSGGKKGLLINSVNLCKGKHRAISTFVGQNGRRSETRPAVQVQCKKHRKRHKKKNAGHKDKTAKKGSARVLAAFRHRVAW